MTVQITCINKSGGYHENPHEAISDFGWTNEQNGERGVTPRDDMWTWIHDKGGAAYVKDAFGNSADVRPQTNRSGTKYLQTEADNKLTDNLLKLPECR